ncbi:CopY/TcrY family copper transport repressor [Gemella sp. 27098_8_92]|uniref:CopY/TcrY family copper transport repressor n=1 Tax=Gemella sp. 27098_8_92 TaxID=3003687 RepID=UPI00352DE3AF
MEINISEAEWEVMRVLWSNSNVTSKLVIETLSEEKKWSASTIKTLLSRLVDKNILQTKKIGNKYIYKAIYSENDCLETLTKNFVGKFCNKKTKRIIEYAIEQDNLSKDDIEEILVILTEKLKNAKDIVKCNCIKGQCTCGNAKIK